MHTCSHGITHTCARAFGLIHATHGRTNGRNELNDKNIILFSAVAAAAPVMQRREARREKKSVQSKWGEKETRRDNYI